MNVVGVLAQSAASTGQRAVTRKVAAGQLATAIVVALSCLPPLVVHAQPLGSEFQVNTQTEGNQWYPAIAAGTSGEFVVIWNGGGQRYASDGSPLGTEFQVTTGYRLPAVAADAAANFVVVSASPQYYPIPGPPPAGTRIFGQRYDSSGTPLGTEFEMNTSVTFYLQGGDADVAVAGDGSFTVVGNVLDLSLQHVIGERYDSNGTPSGPPFRVATTSFYGGDPFPVVAAAASGDFVVVWGIVPGRFGPGGIFGQRYASDGSKLGRAFQVHTNAEPNHYHHDVGAATNGDFVVVWQGSSDGYSSDIFGQRYASNGNPLGPEFRVNTYTTSEQRRPAVSVAANGDFVVVWASMQEGSSWGIFGQRYASNGSRVGTESQVNTYTTDTQEHPAVALANETFVVVWQSEDQDGSGYGVFGQGFTAPPPPPVACSPTPLGGCATPGKSLLLVRDRDKDGAGPSDKVVWKWLKGPAITQASFGDPTTTAQYKFCTYSGTAQTLALEAVVPSGSGWQPVGSSRYTYKDEAAGIAGISLILLKGSDTAAGSKLVVKGKGGNLDLSASTLPFAATDVVVQLSNTLYGDCWQETFPTGSVKKNADARFNAKTP